MLAIGRAVGVDADIDPEARIDMARALGKFKTSMLQDLEAGKALETDAIIGAVVELAELTGVPAPTLRTVYAAVDLLALNRARRIS